MLLVLLMAGGAAAQLPLLANGNIFMAANVDNSNECNLVMQKLTSCADKVGGIDAIASAEPTQLLQCACCDASNLLGDAYSQCSNYIVSEMPASSTDADVYGQLGALCSNLSSCGGPTASITSRASSTSGVTDAAAITGSVTDIDDSCSSLAGIFNSCSDATPGFTDLGFASQAQCYCCGGSSSTWTDEFDQYASTCANWARTADPKTVFPIASRLSTLCEAFSDVCEATATASTSGSSSSSASASARSTGTATSTGTTSTPTETGDSNGSNGGDGSLGSDLKVQVSVVFAAVLFGGVALVL